MSKSAKRRGRPHVALLIETSINYGRGVLRGVAQYQHEHGPWSVFLEQRELGAELPRWIDRWAGDGIIARSDDPRILNAGLPTVGLFDRTDNALGLPMVLNDSRSVGRLAAEHLAERGFRQFAFYGVPEEYWSQLRCEGVRETVAAMSGALEEYRPARGRRRLRDWEAQQNALAAWIRGLPKPLGLIAGNDIHGLRALDACRRAELAVPEEVAVIGADNDAELCELSDPPLSSIAFNPERVGYEAAALLAQLMAGEAPPTAPRIVPPRGVIARQSTEILAIADRTVAQALHFIRRHACEGIRVSSILAAVPVSRRLLEQRFQQTLGRTPKDEIQRVRIERAKELLAQTELSITAISSQIGFHDSAYFSSAFKRQTGKTPREYRGKAESGAAARG